MVEVNGGRVRRGKKLQEQGGFRAVVPEIGLAMRKSARADLR